MPGKLALVGRALLVSACVCALLTASAAGALAQDQNETAADDQPDAEVYDQLGDLVVHSVEYNGDSETMTLEVTWTGETPERATFTEMRELESEGSAQISFKRVRLLPGERTEVQISAQERSSGEAAILATTPQSVERGEAMVIQQGEPTSYPLIRLQNAILGTALSAIGAAGLTFVVVLRNKHDEETGVDRIA